MNRHERETDARIAIDELLRQSGWNPADMSMVGTEVPVTSSQSAVGLVGLVDRSQARAFQVHAPVYDLLAAAGNFGPDRAVGLGSEELGWMPVPGHVRLTRDHFVARVEGAQWIPPSPTVLTASSEPNAVGLGKASWSSSGTEAAPTPRSAASSPSKSTPVRKQIWLTVR